jgi:CRP-like cAMP-binding protein
MLAIASISTRKSGPARWSTLTDAFREEAVRRATLSTLLLRYVQALHVQVSLSAACNGRHTLPQRLAHWLLMARDRAMSDEMPLSHEFLSMMLGVRQAGVTVAVGTSTTDCGGPATNVRSAASHVGS